MTELDRKFSPLQEFHSASEHPLVRSEYGLHRTVSELLSSESLLVVDSYNADIVADMDGAVVLVDDCDSDTIEKIVGEYAFDRVVAVGGCTALDVGRACARGRWMASVPTILSNSCISSSTSVIRRKGHFASERTTTPAVTVLSLPTLIENHSDSSKNWSASGLGDLFSTFAAVAELHFGEGVTDEIIEEHAPICMAALTWLEGCRYPLSEENLLILAEFLHIFSLAGHDSIPPGSEHSLYYALRERHDYPRMVATHGKLVGAGALLTLSAWSEIRRDFAFGKRVHSTFKRVGIPTNFDDLVALGVTRDDMIDGVRRSGSKLFAELFDLHGVNWLDLALGDREFDLLKSQTGGLGIRGNG